MPIEAQSYRLHFLQSQKVHTNRALDRVLSDLNARWQKIRRRHCVSKIQASDVPWLYYHYSLTPETCNDNTGDSTLPRWTFPTRNIWLSCLHCRLHGANNPGRNRSTLVPEVCPFFIHWQNLHCIYFIDVRHCRTISKLKQVVEVMITHTNWSKLSTPSCCGTNMALTMTSRCVDHHSFSIDLTKL